MSPSLCRVCAKPLLPTGIFCPYCGTRQTPPSPSPEDPQTSAPAAYAPTLASPTPPPPGIHTDHRHTPLPPQYPPDTYSSTDTAPHTPQPARASDPSEDPTITDESGKNPALPPYIPHDRILLPLGGILPTGTILGKHYRIEDKIGEGGMGVVYQATDLVMQRTVAIKLLHANLLGEQGIRQRFLREGRLMSSLNHAHVVQVYDLIEDNRVLALVMEYVKGITLTEHLKTWGGQLPYSEILDLMNPILNAMEEAHQQGIIHRDLKPDNILLQHNLTRMFPKIADFGLAKIIEGTSYTVSGALLGTCMYMSPEQIQSERSLDHRADIYSLGITLYQLCTGRCPFQDSNHFALMMAHVQQEPIPPSHLRKDIPPALNQLILHALAKSPEDRLNSCAEFQQRLNQAIGSHRSSPIRVQEETLPPILQQADGYEMILIPGGEFLMGTKRRTVYLDPFYIDRYPVTNRQFQLFLEITNYRPPTPNNQRFLAHWQNGRIPPGLEDHPVTFVSWYDARNYATWAGKALPTEAQWEKSARGQDGRKYPWGREAPDNNRAHFGRNSKGPISVGSKPDGASPYGVLDMAGNVWEWCEDIDDPDFYESGPSHNPRNVMHHSHVHHILRGGSWMYDDARSLRTTTRIAYEPHYRLGDVGFRCIRLPTQMLSPTHSHNTNPTNPHSSNKDSSS